MWRVDSHKSSDLDAAHRRRQFASVGALIRHSPIRQHALPSGPSACARVSGSDPKFGVRVCSEARLRTGDYAAAARWTEPMPRPSGPIARPSGPIERIGEAGGEAPGGNPAARWLLTASHISCRLSAGASNPGSNPRRPPVPVLNHQSAGHGVLSSGPLIGVERTRRR